MQNETQIFPPKEVAMELKRVGFDWECVGWYNSDHEDNSTKPIIEGDLSKNSEFVSSCSAPTYDQVIGWFAEVHGIEINNKVDIDFKEWSTHVWYKIEGKAFDTPWYPNRQQSLLTAFREAIKLIEK